MKKIGLIYSFNSNKSAQIADKIANHFSKDEIEKVNAEEITKDKFASFDNLILSCPTWFDGELPNYWDEFVPALEELGLKGKTVAIYGNGDQKGYPENFVDAVGVMAKLMENLGAKVVGYTSREGYTYESSKAERGDQFCGLAIDFENQAKLNNKRVEDWCNQLKTEFH